VNIEDKVSENNFCKSESNVTHAGNIVVIINLLCAFVQNNIFKRCGGSISFLKIHQSGEVL
jgi:hypothetical protein